MSNDNFEICEFQAWKQWVAQRGRCQTTTAKGHQCKNPCTGMGSDICNNDDFEEVEFKIGITDRCRVHARVPERGLSAATTKINPPQ